MANPNNDKYPNVLLAGVWPTDKGHFSTMSLDAKAYDALIKHAEIGGKLLIRKRSAETIAGSRNPERTPPYFLEFVPAEEVRKFEENRPKRDSSGL
jgi:uncharacterized protein (DUF1330 family)